MRGLQAFSRRSPEAGDARASRADICAPMKPAFSLWPKYPRPQGKPPVRAEGLRDFARYRITDRSGMCGVWLLTLPMPSVKGGFQGIFRGPFGFRCRS